MKDFVKDLRSRINPIYVDQPGTESFERQLCADVIERLDMEATAWEVRVDNLKAENDRLIDRHSLLINENNALYQEIRTEQRLSFREQVEKLTAEVAKLKEQPVPERAEETHCPHGILIADWCKQCFDETNAYFESIEDKP